MNLPIIKSFENLVLNYDLAAFLIIFFVITFISFIAKLFFERYSLKFYSYISNLYILNI